MEPLRVVIIEDNDFTRSCFKTLATSESSCEHVAAYRNFELASVNLKTDKPNILVIDIELPGLNGIDGLRRALSLFPNCRSIIFSSHESEENIIKAFEAGANGFISKSEVGYLDNFVNCLRLIAEGKPPVSYSVLSRLLSTFKRSQSTPLSERETEILGLFGQGNSYTDIAGKLFISKNTVRTHIRNIYEKLDVRKKNEAISVARTKRLIQ